jgi:ABC-type nitrate/sulfonate/bicarbonate transport system substrate-binding protein
MMSRTILLALGLLAAASPAFAQKMQEINVYVVKNLLSSPHFVALENGYWAEQGLNVQLKLTSGGRMVVQALQANEAQLGHVAISGTLAIARAGGDKLIGVIPYYNAADYMGRASAYAIVGRKDRGIDAANPASIIGKKLGFTAGTDEYYMRQWFRRQKLDISKVQLVSVLVEDMPVTLSQGIVDATVPWEPYASQTIRELGANAAVLSRGEAGLISDNVGLVGNEAWIAKNPDTVEKYTLGLVQATKFIRENRQETADIVARYLDGLNVIDAAEGLSHLIWDPRISVCVIEGSIRTGNGMARSGQIKMDRPFTAADFYNTTVYERIIAKHAELFAGLPPLPTKIEDCKGQLEN